MGVGIKLLTGFALLLCLLGLSACESGHPEHSDLAEQPEPKSPAATSTQGAETSGGETAEEESSSPAEPTIVHSSLGPDDLVHHYLSLGAAGDLSRVKDFIDPACYDGPIGRVEAVRMVGVRIAVSQLDLLVESEDAEAAVVHFTIQGDVDATNLATEIDLDGNKVELSTASLTIADVKKQGRLTLARKSGLWRVTCPRSISGAASEAPESSP
ncbi:MAG: hypothetical protein VX498_07260 [Myxococcota bacterium]|nr:hypothetical protein [Myxococcota bacterium]